MAKTVEVFANQLCKIIDKITPLRQKVNDKKELFQKIFQIFEHDAKMRSRGMFWQAVTEEKCHTEHKDTLNQKLEQIMYKQSYTIRNTVTEQIKDSVLVPSLLFLELLLYLIEQLRDYPEQNDIDFFRNFILVVEHSDTSGIFNIGIDYLDFFLKITRDNTAKLRQVIQAIDSEFEKKDYKRTGNYSLAHVIRNYCNALIPPDVRDVEAADNDDDDDDAAAAAAAAAADNWVVDDSTSPMTVSRTLNILRQSSKFQPTGIYIKRGHAESDPRDAAAAAGAAGDSRPQCRYGSECYQKNPEHLKKFAHPPKGGAVSHNTKSRIKRRATYLRRTKRRHRRTKRHTRCRRH